MITLEPMPTVKDLAKLFHKIERLNSNAIYLNSGKSAIALLIKYFKNNGRIRDKNASVFVPKWIGSPVYQEIAGHAIPSGSAIGEHDIYLMYHQYGYSQNISRYMSAVRSTNPIIIEDCAHRIEGPVLSDRDVKESYSIFSYNKFLFCFLLGGIQTSDLECSVWLQQELDRSKYSVILNLFKLMDEILVHSQYFEKKDIFINYRKMTFSVYSSYPTAVNMAKSLKHRSLDSEIFRRTKIYSHLVSRLGPMQVLPECWAATSAPYAIPVRGNLQKLQKLQAMLGELKIRVPINNFDFNLNNLDPKFEKAIILPCHSQLGDATVDNIEKMTYKILA